MQSTFASMFKRPVLAAFIFGASAALSAQNLAPGVASAAQRDFGQFVQYNLQKRAGTLPAHFPLDITDIQDLKDARLGFGFPVYTIDPKDLLQGRGDLRSMTRPTGEWRHLITLHDRPIGMATLVQTNGQWHISAYSGAVLAQEIDAAIGAHGNAQRSNVRFVRVYQAMSDLLEVVSPGDNHARYMPLQSARQMLLAQQRSGATVNAGLLEQADILEPMRASVKTNMETSR